MVRSFISKEIKKAIFLIKKVKNQKKWKKEEDALLIRLAKKFNEKNWKEIASNFVNKNPLQCFSRFKRIKPGIKKGTWKKDEDMKILELVNKYGKSWSKLSKEIKTRNGKQIRDRYLNVLDPSINKGKFTSEDDLFLMTLYNTHGPKWAFISTFFENRTADMIKNRFHSSIKKRVPETNDSLSQIVSINTKTSIFIPGNKCNYNNSIESVLSIECENKYQCQSNSNDLFNLVFFNDEKENDFQELNYDILSLVDDSAY